MTLTSLGPSARDSPSTSSLRACSARLRLKNHITSLLRRRRLPMTRRRTAEAAAPAEPTAAKSAAVEAATVSAKDAAAAPAPGPDLNYIAGEPKRQSEKPQKTETPVDEIKNDEGKNPADRRAGKG